MRLIFFFTLIASLFSHVCLSQQQSMGNRSVEAGAGISEDGISFYGAYAMRMGKLKENSPLYLKASLFYETGSGKGVDYATLGADVIAGYTLLKVTPSLWISLNAGITTAYDKLTTPLIEGTAQNDYSQVKVGVLGGAELQWRFARKLSFIAGGDQRYLFGNETWGHVRWSAYGGLRYALK